MLRITNLSKCYPSYKSNVQRFLHWFGIPIEPISQFWAVRDISLDVPKGQSVAVIGQNGAGKSTFLKLVTGTVRSTTGSVATNGRISAILELGLGFNPEFTGRQNVITAGGMLGYSASEITEMLPWIEEFSELDEFFDQPLRVYSTGMQARLSFSLATAKRPDILIVDEVLSVGDTYFQHKSFDRIRQFRSEGTSILLVTHALNDVRAICDRVVLLDKGKILKDGEPDEVVDYYNALIATRENERALIEQKRNDSGWTQSRSGSLDAVVESVEITDPQSNKPLAVVTVGQEITLNVRIKARASIPHLVFGFMIRDRTGHIVFGTNTWHTGHTQIDIKKEEILGISFHFSANIGIGSYSISTALHARDTHIDGNYEWIDNHLVFDVVNLNKPIFIGTNSLDPVIRIER